MKTGSNRWTLLLVIAVITLGVFTACSKGNRESDENVGNTPPPEPEAVTTAGTEPAPDDSAMATEPESDEPVAPTTNEVAAAVGSLGEETGKADEVIEAEDPGDYIGARETWDERVGSARLVLSYDAGQSAFVGTVQNVTRGGICGVQVWVHLSTGTELGPTTSTDVASNQTVDVRLPSGTASFEGWNARMGMQRCAP